MSISPSLKKIITLLSDGQFHSGTELADKVGVSRSAICKQINNLTELGLEFNAVTGKGYKLEQSCQLLSKTAINKHLSPSTHQLISKLEIHDSLSSTNNYLVEKSQFNKPDTLGSNGLVCFAEHQTAGKGRRGRHWVSPFASNLYLSILWNFQNGPASINGLSLAIGVAVIRALKDHGINDAGLKWPNDILWQGKKLAGILIEVSGETNGPSSAVIGLGLNFYLSKKQAQPITQEWIDLNHILSGHSEKIRNQLAGSLLNHLMPTIAYFEEDGLEKYLQAWQNDDCMKGKKADIFMGTNKFTGIVEGIDNNGLLLLQDELGVRKKFASGEVSFHQS